MIGAVAIAPAAWLALGACSLVLPEAVDPLWSTGSPERIEWAALVGPPDAPCVLVATETGRVQVIDVRGGHALRSWNLDAPGTVLCGANERAAFCSDGVRLWALPLTGPQADPDSLPLWETRVTVLGQRRPDDPEDYPRGAGRLLGDAVILARNDGWIGGVRADDGQALWRKAAFANEASILLEVDGAGCLLTTRGAAARLALFDPQTGELAADVRLSSGAPLRAVALGARLALVYAGLVEFVDARGNRVQVDLPGEFRASAALIAGRNAERGWELLLCDAQSGACVSVAPVGEAQPLVTLDLKESETPLALDAFGTWAALRCAAGTWWFRQSEAPTLVACRPLSAWAEGDRAWVLTHAPDRTLLLNGLNFRADPGSEAGETELRTVALRADAPAAIRNALWAPDRVLLIETRRVRAYTLPR